MTSPYAPTALPVTRYLRDYRDDVQVSAAAAAGTCQVLWEIPSTDLWLVDRITVSSSSSTPTAAAVYVGTDPTTYNLRDGTQNGNLDFADYNSPLTVPSSRTLLIVWTGASDGAKGTAAIQYRVMTQQAG